MRALIHTAPFTFEMQDVPRPVPAADEVLVRVRAVGICGSDVHGMTGKTGRRIPPLIMGHEAAGDVVEVGSAVNGDWLNRRVTFDSTLFCGACDACARGDVNLCENRQVLGVSCAEYRRDGAFAEFVAVPARVLYELPAAVSYDHGAMAEPLSVALHAVRLAGLRSSDRVLVIGCGIIGLLAIAAARATGCREIIGTDLSARRRAVALECGAGVAVAPEQLAKLGEVDVALEAVGAPKTVALAIGSVRKGGTVVLIGNVAAEVPFQLQAVVSRQIRFQGSCASAGEYPHGLALLKDGSINADRLITDTVTLEETAEMLKEIYSNPDAHLKAIVHP